MNGMQVPQRSCPAVADIYKTTSSESFLPFAILEVDQKQMTRRSTAGSPASVRRQASGRDGGIAAVTAVELNAKYTVVKLVAEVTVVNLFANVSVLKLVAEVTAVKLIAEATHQTTDVFVATICFTDNLTT